VVYTYIMIDKEIINKKSKYSHNEDYFKVIDTEYKAYILGFIIADGSIEDNNRIKKSGEDSITYRLTFCNSIDDKEIIDKIKEQISPESIIYHTINTKGAVTRKEQLVLRICSRILCTDLINLYNIQPRKTLNSTFEIDLNKIPDNLLRHFIRGFFDGDGAVSFHKYNNTIFFNFGFVLNSLNFTKQICKIFEDLFDIKGVIYTHTSNTCIWYSLRFNYNRNRTEKIKLIYNYLYEDSNIYLTRKKDKFVNYLKYRANSENS
jgi:hypothetical protein